MDESVKLKLDEERYNMYRVWSWFLAVVSYVFFNPHSHSHFFNKLDIHTSYMHKYSSPLSLVSHLLLHILTQAIIYNYLTLEPQGGVEQRHGGFRQRHLHRITEFAKVGIQV